MRHIIFDHELEDDEGRVSTVSVCVSVSEYRPAVRYLRNGDPGYPAEGGEVEEITVALSDGTEMNPIPEDLYDALEQIAIDKAEEELEW